ncbi:MAG: NRDE family protein [Acidimicrobiales bacterium]
MSDPLGNFFAPLKLSTVCLLIFAWHVEPSYPLVVAANRDERYERPATSFCVLRESTPRMLGGRDELAGGTWLAVNEYAVVAGLTNRPSPAGRDPTKRSRGELPRLLAEHRSAEGAVADLVERVRPADYNPAWLLVGDRRSLYYVELATSDTPTVHQLGPGVHVLENVPLGTNSPKVERVHSSIATTSTTSTTRSPLWSLLPSVLADHTVVATSHEGTDNGDTPRSRATLAPCVHTTDYGTRSATLVRVSLNPEDRPEMLVADGAPCTAPFVDVTRHWSG